MSIQLVWFKRDLRFHDHAPLADAAKAGKCICLFVYEPELLEADDCATIHLEFINQSLTELRKSLRAIGGELVLRTGKVITLLEQIHHQYGIQKIWAHQETFNHLSYQRDRQVRFWAKAANIPISEIPQFGVVRRLSNRDLWANHWQRLMNQPVTYAPTKIDCVKEISPGSIQDPANFKMNSVGRTEIQMGGEPIADDTLKSFLAHRGENYRTQMSSPLAAGLACSRLSPYIAFGNISLRTIYQAAGNRLKEIPAHSNLEKHWRQSLSSFNSRLHWHCHFMQKLEDQPEIEFQNMNPAFDGLREDQFNEDYFQAWCQGKTGYPLIDACMRCLRQTGWLNFRMRAMVVSFAAYHLWLHWRRPAIYLAQLFLDYEPGIHYSQFQMQSGVTGINTIRIYSPIKQAQEQDPEGRFIRKFVPELADVPDKHIAQPHQMNLMEQSLFGCQIGKDYPRPIVDHATEYAAARDRIHARKNARQTKQHSAQVYEKHGSRKQKSK